MEITDIEQSQLESLKIFWQKYGKMLSVLLMLVFVSLGGFQYYQHHQKVQAQNASQSYDIMIHGMAQQDFQTAKTQALILTTQYPKSPYAGFARLILAKLFVSQQDFKQAKYHLETALSVKKFDFISALANIHLAKIELEEGLLEKALSRVSSQAPKGYEILYEEVKGDIFIAQKAPEKAKVAYETAIQFATLGMPVSHLQLKLEGLN